MKADLMIYFNNEQSETAITYSLKILVRRAIEATLAYEGFANDAEVSVSFTDNEGIRRLNAQFRNIDKETDVLSFPLTDFDGDGEPPVDEPGMMLGDIVISLERAAEQAEEYGHSFEREVAFLCVHSMLHLLGYDHVDSEEDDAEMRRRQREILESMGLGVN